MASRGLKHGLVKLLKTNVFKTNQKKYSFLVKIKKFLVFQSSKTSLFRGKTTKS